MYRWSPPSIHQSRTASLSTKSISEEAQQPNRTTAIAGLPASQSKSARRSRTIVGAMAFFVLTAAALVQSLSVLAQSSTESSVPASGPHTDPDAGYAYPSVEHDTLYALERVLASNRSSWRYPTDFTRGIVPVCSSFVLKTLSDLYCESTSASDRACRRAHKCLCPA